MPGPAQMQDVSTFSRSTIAVTVAVNTRQSSVEHEEFEVQLLDYFIYPALSVVPSSTDLQLHPRFVNKTRVTLPSDTAANVIKG